MGGGYKPETVAERFVVQPRGRRGTQVMKPNISSDLGKLHRPVERLATIMHTHDMPVLVRGHVSKPRHEWHRTFDCRRLALLFERGSPEQRAGDELRDRPCAVTDRATPGLGGAQPEARRPRESRAFQR
jgi:hypothetical protein